jgi:hypothetical protein
MVSFTSRPIYHQVTRNWYKLDRNVGRPQSRSGLGGEHKSLTLPEIEKMMPVPQPVHYTDSKPSDLWCILYTDRSI